MPIGAFLFRTNVGVSSQNCRSRSLC
jgi:hypothetical protein